MSSKQTSIGVHILKLVSSRLVVQAIGALTLPLLARLYLPQHFGAVQIIDAFQTILLVVVCCKFEMAIPLARDAEEMAATITISFLADVSITMLVIFGVLLFAPTAAAWYKLPSLRLYLWILPLLVFIGGIRQILTYWSAKEERFTVVASSDIAYSLSERAGSLGWGLLIAPSTFGLLMARLIGNVARLGVLLQSCGVKMRQMFHAAPLSRHTLLTTIKRHKKFPLFQVWTVFLNTISVQLPPLILGRYFSADIVGFYALGDRTVALPMMLLQDAITTVSYPVMVKEYQRTGSLTEMTKSLYLRLLQVSLFPMLIISVFGVELFRMIFGEQWIISGEYARLLAIWQAVAFINIPMRVFVILDRQEIGLLMNVIMLFMRVGGIMIGVLMNSPLISLQAFVAFSVAALLANIFWQLHLAQAPLLWAVFEFCQYAILSLALLFFVKWIVNDAHAAWLLSGLVGATLGYVGVVMLIDESFRQYVSTRFRRRNR